MIRKPNPNRNFEVGHRCMERRKGVVIIFSIRGRTDCTCWPSLASSVASVRTFTIFPADVQPLLDSFLPVDAPRYRTLSYVRWMKQVKRPLQLSDSCRLCPIYIRDEPLSSTCIYLPSCTCMCVYTYTRREIHVSDKSNEC